MRIFLLILSNPGILKSIYALVPENLYTREDKGMTSDMNGLYPVSGLLGRPGFRCGRVSLIFDSRMF